MPSPNPSTRREYKGNAKGTTLAAPIINSGDTSFTIVDSTGWPTGSVGKFVVTINSGFSDEEKILCSTRVGTTVNVDTRGFDGTTAAGHASTATAAHTISAFDADEWNAHTNASTAVHGVAGSVVGTTDSQVLTNKTLTSPTINTPTVTGSGGTLTLPAGPDTLVGRATTDTLTNKTLASPAFTGTATGLAADAASTIGGVSGTSLAADRTAWTVYTPTFSNIASAAGSFGYKLIGKTLYLRVFFSAGTASTTSATFTLPGGVTGGPFAATFVLVGGSNASLSATAAPAGTVVTLGVLGPTNVTGYAGVGVIEVA